MDKIKSDLQISYLRRNVYKNKISKHQLNLLTKFLFSSYIYPSDLKKSDSGTTHRTSNYLKLFPEMPKYCCLIEIFYLFFLVL